MGEDIENQNKLIDSFFPAHIFIYLSLSPASIRPTLFDPLYHNTNRCALDSPVHLQTEGNHDLPNEVQTAPWSLRAIKGPLGAWSCQTSIL
jgi:hypothetical protein